MKRLLLLLLLPLSSLAQDPLPNTYVNDFANVLSPAQVSELNDSIKAIETRSSVEIAVVLIKHTDIDIADYALQLGRKWGVGNAGNGIVYVAAIEDHKQRLEIGSHLEGNITDAQAREITDLVKPDYRAGYYFDGLQKLLKGIKKQIDPSEQLSYVKPEERHSMGWGWIFLFLSLAVAGGWVLYRFVFKKEEETDYTPPPPPSPFDDYTYSSRAAPVMPDHPPMPGAHPPSPPPPPTSSGSSYKSEDSYKSNDSDINAWGGNSSFSGGGATNDW